LIQHRQPFYSPKRCRFPLITVPFCRYEPIEKRIEHAKVLIVNDLLRYDDDLSDLAREEWNGTKETKLRFERKISAYGVRQYRQKRFAAR
jgi:hypothetical protein